MPKKLVNWDFSDIENFLKKNNFVLHHTNGSHYYYRGHYDKKLRMVCIPFHGSKTIKPKTLKGIILQSGINKDTWLK